MPDVVHAWIEVLDDLTYYELFGIAQSASVDDVRQAFHVFCDTFHPDRHLGRPASERDAVSSIFKRGTEAYLVLCDLGYRERYDAQISVARPSAQRLTFSPHGAPASKGPARLEDSVRSPSARPFARRAEELIENGDLRQAKLQLVMANHKDPSNAELEAALRNLLARMAGGPERK